MVGVREGVMVKERCERSTRAFIISDSRGQQNRLGDMFG